MDEDYTCDNFNGIRVIKTAYKIYVQREYMVTGYEDNGEYNPCINTEWNTLIQKLSTLENIREKVAGYKSFISIEEVVRFFINASIEEVGYSSMYRKTKNIVDFQIIATEETIREDYLEYFL